VSVCCLGGGGGLDNRGWKKKGWPKGHTRGKVKENKTPGAEEVRRGGS